MKLHLPKMLTAALIAAFAVSGAYATTTKTTTYEGGTVFNGDIWTWNNADGKSVSNVNSKYTNYTTGQTYAGNANMTSVGGADAFWKMIQFNGENAYVGNTLRFAGATGSVRLNTDYDKYVWVGGIITEAGNSGTYTLGRDNNTSFYLKGNQPVNMIINSNFTFWATNAENSAVEIGTGGTWTVADGKVLEFNVPSVVHHANQTVNINGTGTVKFTKSYTGQAGAIFNVGEGATLTFAQAAQLGGTITNNGTVNFNGAVSLSDSLTGFDAEEKGQYVDHSGATATDGYYQGVTEYTLVKGNAATGLTSVTYGGQSYDVTDNKITVGSAGDTDWTTYHLRTSGSSMNLEDELNHNPQLHTVTMATGTTLNADADFAGTVSGAGTATVNVATGKVLSGTVSDVALSGTGIYALGSGVSALPTGVTLASDWTGAVRISSTSDVKNLAADQLVNADGTSWIEFYGFKGYTVTWAAGTYGNMTQNVILTKTGDTPAWELSAFATTDASGNPPHTMVATGTWKGDGTFKTAGGASGQSQGVEYQGNISGWEGTFEANSSGLRRVTFSNDAKDVNASVVNTGAGVLQVVVNTDATFSKSVTANKLTINDGMTATLKGAATLGGLVSTGSLVVDADTNTVSISGEGNVLDHAITLKSGTLNLTGSYDISALEVQDKQLSYKGGEGVATGSGFEMLSGTITVVDKTAGTLNHSEATFLYGGQAVTVTDGIGTLAGEPNYSALWVNGTDTVRYAAAQTIAGGTTVESVHLNAEGATITMDQADATIGIVLSEGISGTVYATAATTIGSVTGLGTDQVLTISGTAPVTLGAAISGTTLAVNGGSLDLGNISHTLDALTVTNGQVTTTSHGGTGCISGDLYINAGGTFTVAGLQDAFGYNDGKTDNIIMQGTEQSHATLQLNHTAASVTMSTDIQMKGYADITTATTGFNTFGGNITASGVANTIDAIQMRNNVTITVEDEGALTLHKLALHSGDSILTKAGAGTLTIDGGANVIHTTIAVEGGILNLDGTFAIGSIAGTENASYAGGVVADNGFKTSSTTRTVFTKGDGANVTVGQDARFMVGEEAVELLDNGTATTAATTDYAAFYVNSESENVSQAFKDQHQPTSFHLSENTGLVVDQDVTAAVRGAGASSMVTIAAARTLTGTARNVTIAGSGTYALDNATVALGNGVALDGGWAGIVSVSGVTFNGNFDTVCGNLANDDSWIELKDTKGHLNNGGNQTFTYDANLILSRGEDGWAYAQNNGNDNSVLVFTGTIVGDGNLGRSVGTGSTYTYEFTGDISGWNGQFISRNLDKKSTTFKLSGEHEGDMEVRATLVNKGTDFYVAVNTDATFKADVAATKVTVAENKTATFTEDATIGTIEGLGKVVVGGGATLKVTNSVADSVAIEARDGARIDGSGIDSTQVGIAAAATATFAQGITDVSGVVFTKEDGVEVKNTNDSQGGEAINYSIGEASAKVTADTLTFIGGVDTAVANQVVVDEIVNVSGRKLTLQNAETMELKSMIISETSTVEMLYTDEEVQKEGTVTITDTLTAGGGTLLANLTLKDDSTLNLSIDGNVVALTLGSTLTVAPEGGLVTLDADTIAALETLDVNGSLELVSAAPNTELLYGGNYKDLWFGQLFTRTDAMQGDYKVYATADGFGLTKVSAVPEPTTGTLSLLALAALAARRRRK